MGIDLKEGYLQISKKRKIEIVNPLKAALLREKIIGLKNRNELNNFLPSKQEEEYQRD